MSDVSIGVQLVLHGGLLGAGLSGGFHNLHNWVAMLFALKAVAL
jgi:hypothetical protein